MGAAEQSGFVPSSKPPAILHVHPGACDPGHVIYPSQPLEASLSGKTMPRTPHPSRGRQCAGPGDLGSEHLVGLQEEQELLHNGQGPGQACQVILLEKHANNPLVVQSCLAWVSEKRFPSTSPGEALGRGYIHRAGMDDIVSL